MADIGIMGGTFDPVHNGHLILGKQAYEEYGLDAVWFMPSGQPPHKKDRHVTPAGDRCAMVKLAIGDFPGFVFSDFEVLREGSTYTAQTLALLKETYGDHNFCYIIGADSLYEIESWYHPELVLSGVPLLVDEQTHRPYPSAPLRRDGYRYPGNPPSCGTGTEHKRLCAKGRGSVYQIPPFIFIIIFRRW